MRDFDRRQSALCKLSYDPVATGTASIDVVLQSQNYAGATSALRHAETASENDTRKARVMQGDAHGTSPYTTLQQMARRLHTVGSCYAQLVNHIVKESCRDRNACCIAIDHAGGVKQEKLNIIFRACDDAAYRREVGVRLILIVTKVEQWDACKRCKVLGLPAGHELLYPRQRTWDFSHAGFKLVKPSAAVQLLSESAPNLLSGIEQSGEAPAVKIA